MVTTLTSLERELLSRGLTLDYRVLEEISIIVASHICLTLEFKDIRRLLHARHPGSALSMWFDRYGYTKRRDMISAMRRIAVGLAPHVDDERVYVMARRQVQWDLIVVILKEALSQVLHSRAADASKTT